MGVEENLRIVRGTFDAVNARDWLAFRSLHAESMLLTNPFTREPARGPAAAQARIEQILRTLPDLTFRPVQAFGHGDWVCTESVIEGNHTGPLETPDGRTIPATHRHVRYSEARTFRVEGGQITEVHAYFDLLGLFAQLGMRPTPGAATAPGSPNSGG